MRIAPKTAARALVALACAALLAFALAGPATAAQAQGASSHSLTKKLPKKWVKKYHLKGKEASPLADPDGDTASNWVEFRQKTHPRKRNKIMQTAPTTAVPASRIILLEGYVVTSAPTGFTLQLESGLIVNVAVTPTSPIVDRGGLPTTIAPGAEVHAFVSQVTDLSLTAVLVFVDAGDDPGEQPVSDDDDDDEGMGGPPCDDEGQDGRKGKDFSLRA